MTPNRIKIIKELAETFCEAIKTGTIADLRDAIFDDWPSPANGLAAPHVVVKDPDHPAAHLVGAQIHCTKDGQQGTILYPVVVHPYFAVQTPNGVQVYHSSQLQFHLNGEHDRRAAFLAAFLTESGKGWVLNER